MIDANTIIDYTHEDFLNGIHKIANDIRESGFAPDYIVGVVRGGSIPAVYLSHILKLPLAMVHWSSRDSNLAAGNESNCWIPEDAELGKQILLVDDIVDGGDTIRQILEDWNSSVFKPLKTENIKIASLFYNTAQNVIVDYYHKSINRDEDGRWVVFPWEAA